MPLLSLSDLLVPEALELHSFTPPKRFQNTHFRDYIPQDDSQATAVAGVQAFVAEAVQIPERPKRRWFRKAVQLEGRGLYLDGGFGVGKTHLLASAYNALDISPREKAYLSFQELVYVIGVLKKEGAAQHFAPYRFICIDEFELDDSGNTLLVKSFLARVFPNNCYVMTTSNTVPTSQGKGRFNAEDFKREIQSIADSFEVLSVGGPDYRQRSQLASLLSSEEVQRILSRYASYESKRCLKLGFEEFIAYLASLHPIRYGRVLEQTNALVVTDLQTIRDQNAALRFVHFIDKLYDMNIAFAATGAICLSELFDESYRDGAYTKKYYRCLSRLSELLEEISAE